LHLTQFLLDVSVLWRTNSSLFFFLILFPTSSQKLFNRLNLGFSKTRNLNVESRNSSYLGGDVGERWRGGEISFGRRWHCCESSEHCKSLTFATTLPIDLQMVEGVMWIGRA
jgi:hypothetical protein